MLDQVTCQALWNFLSPTHDQVNLTSLQLKSQCRVQTKTTLLLWPGKSRLD